MSDDEFRVVTAIRAALPTRRHAEMLFEQVADRLGDGGWSAGSKDGLRRVLYRRDAPGTRCFLPWPLLDLSLRERQTIPWAIDGVPVEPPPRPEPRGAPPRLRNLGPGEVTIHDGPQSITITYGADGRCVETTRGGPPETLHGALAALGTATASPVELLAAFVSDLDLSTCAPGRVVMPTPLPGGLPGTWLCGLHALREALFEGRIPPDARFVAVDGFAASVLVCGSSREETLERWRAEVERVRPQAPVPAPAPPEPSEPSQPHDSPASFEPPRDFEPPTEFGDRSATFGMHMRIEAKSAIPMPEQTPENTPAIFVELSPPPLEPSPADDWVPLLGHFGETVHAARRRDDDGFTLVGDHALHFVALERLDALLDAADERADRDAERTNSLGLPTPRRPYDTQTREYLLLDDRTGLPLPTPRVRTSRTRGFHARNLDGAQLRRSAVRVRRIGAI